MLAFDVAREISSCVRTQSRVVCLDASQGMHMGRRVGIGSSAVLADCSFCTMHGHGDRQARRSPGSRECRAW